LLPPEPGKRVQSHAIGPAAAASAGLEAALSLLSVASVYADDVGCAAWEIAVAWETFRERLVAPNDLQRLVRKGFVDHKIDLITTSDVGSQMKYKVARSIFQDSTSILIEAA
jgi:hypothetical protein